MLTLRARLRFFTNRNIAELSIKGLTEMTSWNTYQRTPFTNAKEVIGETLEYLDHSIKASGFHPKFNPDNDKKYAIIQCVKHGDNGMTPLSVTIGSAIILDWLNNVSSFLVQGQLLFFRFLYNDKANPGEPKWSVEYMNVDKSSDYVPYDDVEADRD